METKQFTTLQFGTVEIYSDWGSSSVRVRQSDGSRLQWTAPDAHTDISLQQGRLTWTRDEKLSLSKRILQRAEAELNASYPGGYDAAVADFHDWLLAVPGRRFADVKRPTATIANGMIQEQYTTLIFSDVEIYSDSTGSFLRISRAGNRSSPEYLGVQTDSCIENGRLEWNRETKLEISEYFLQRAEDALESSYPGGYRSAVNDLRSWLLEEGPS